MDAWTLGRGCDAPGLDAVAGDTPAHERRVLTQQVSRAPSARARRAGADERAAASDTRPVRSAGSAGKSAIGSPFAWWQILAVSCLALALVACAARSAPNFRGQWQPVNRFAEVPREIPLHQAYVYTPLPLDRTLKSMLTRWARDSRMALSYLHGSDYTLHQPVAGIRTSNLRLALEQLSQAYASQGVAISVDDNRITVRPAGVAAETETAASP